MKPSLYNAFTLFTYAERIEIFCRLICLKFRIKTTPSANFSDFNNYVRLLDKGINFKNADKGLINVSLEINKKNCTVFLRKNTSDLQVFESVLLQEEYKIAAEQLFKVKIDDLTIVDAGGNIGLTSVYFNFHFPHAKFFIIEPDAGNFALLKKNLQGNNMRNVVLFKNALWVKHENLKINNSFRDGKDWSLSVEKSEGVSTEANSTYIEGISISEICSAEDIKTIDLLKIDIEGAERFLFKDESFLGTIKKHATNVVIEIHDEFNIRETINKKMNEMGFSRKEETDLTLFSINAKF